MFPELAYLQADWRFEYKYRLTRQQYLQVRSHIIPLMRLDEHSRIAPHHRYLVRSLYLDTNAFTNYVEKVHGDSDRVKLRIRTYTTSPQESTPIRVEFKARRGIAVEKHSTWVEHHEYEDFLFHSHFQTAGDPVLTEFERYVHLKTLRPKIIVEYMREGYRARSGENLRVTFDHHVRSAHAGSLFPANPFFHPHHPAFNVLEIKCDENQPAWLGKMVEYYGLRPCTNSKYIQGINAARKDVVTPGWSH